MHDHREWNAWVLIPFWIIQVLFTAALLGLTIYSASVVAHYHLLYVGAVIVIIFAALSIIFNLIEVVCYTKHNLKPLLYLIFNVLSTLFWLIWVVISAISASTTGFGWFDLIICAVTCALFAATTIYGGVIYHRERTRTVRGYSTARQTKDPYEENAWCSSTYGNPSRISLDGEMTAYDPHAERMAAEDSHNSRSSTPATAPSHGQPQIVVHSPRPGSTQALSEKTASRYAIGRATSNEYLPNDNAKVYEPLRIDPSSRPDLFDSSTADHSSEPYAPIRAPMPWDTSAFALAADVRRNPSTASSIYSRPTIRSPSPSPSPNPLSPSHLAISREPSAASSVYSRRTIGPDPSLRAPSPQPPPSALALITSAPTSAPSSSSDTAQAAATTGVHRQPSAATTITHGSDSPSSVYSRPPIGSPVLLDAGAPPPLPVQFRAFAGAVQARQEQQAQQVQLQQFRQGPVSPQQQLSERAWEGR